VTTSPVTSPRPPKVLTGEETTTWRAPACRGTPPELDRAWGNLDTSGCVYSPKHVAIPAAFPYNRDQMSGQTSFDAYPIFCGRNAQIVQRLVRLVVADQHFTKSVHRLVRTYMLSQPVRSGGKHFAASLPRNPTTVHVTHYVSTCAGS
jgi:hypothetical protein